MLETSRMLSRVADALYWMSRYLERAEHTARLVDVNIYLTLDRTPERRDGTGPLFESLQVTLADGGPSDARARAPARPRPRQPTRSPRSVPRARTRARCASRSAPRCGSAQSALLDVRRTADDASWQDEPHQFLRGVIDGCHLFRGSPTPR